LIISKDKPEVNSHSVCKICKRSLLDNSIYSYDGYCFYHYPLSSRSEFQSDIEKPDYDSPFTCSDCGGEFFFCDVSVVQGQSCICEGCLEKKHSSPSLDKEDTSQRTLQSKALTPLEIDAIKYNRGVKSRTIAEKHYICGNIIERDVFYPKFVTGKNKITKKGSGEVSSDNICRSRRRRISNLRRYTNSNWYNSKRRVFLTFTFDRDISRPDAVKEWNNFLARLKRRIDKYYGASDYRIIKVSEYQLSGRIHFHCLFFDLPYIDVFTHYFYDNRYFKTRYNLEVDYPASNNFERVYKRSGLKSDALEDFKEYFYKVNGRLPTCEELESCKRDGLEDIWRNGFCYIEKVKSRNVGNYLVKYMGKTERYNRDERLYSVSRNCIKPEVKEFAEYQKGYCPGEFREKDSFEISLIFFKYADIYRSFPLYYYRGFTREVFLC